MRRYFKCSTCTIFQITKVALERLAKAPQVWRNEFAEAARTAPAGHALVIYRPPMTPGNEDVRLVGEYVSINELPN
jgi:hypothetical protein